MIASENLIKPFDVKDKTTESPSINDEYVYNLEYTTEDELVVYYNKLVLSLYGENKLEFIDGNKFNLTHSNVIIL